MSLKSINFKLLNFAIASTIAFNIANAQAADQKAENYAITKEYLLQLIAIENEAVRRQKFEVEISEQSIPNALSIFEPTWSFEYESSYGDEQNDANLRVQRSSNSTYQFEDRDYRTAIEGLLPTGTEYELYYEMSDPSNSLQSDSEFGKEYQATAGIVVTQPLLKNFGLGANLANYRVAVKEKEITEQTLRQTKNERIFDAAQAYVDLQFAEKRVRNELKLLKIERQGVDIVSQLAAQGRVDRAAVFQAESDLARREARVEISQKAFRRASNVIRRMLVGTEGQTRQMIFPANEIDDEMLVELLGTDNLDYAYAKRPELLSAQKQVEVEDIRLDYAWNQRLPELNVIGEIGKTGLSDVGIEAHKALGSTYKFWSIRVELDVPMLGDMQSRSSYHAAKLRKNQAQLMQHSLEELIAAEIDWAEYEVGATEENLQRYGEILKTSQAALNELQKKVDNGRANRYELLRQQSDFIQIETNYLEKLVEYRKASLGLLLAQGRLLDHFNLENGKGS